MGTVLQHRKCLVLNKNWRPISTVTLEDAITKVFSTYNDGTPKARIIEPESYQAFTWSDWAKIKPSENEERISSANMSFRVPEIILLSKYEKSPHQKIYFSRRTLFKRDNMQCQYCGCMPGSEELTIEHIVPRSKGGLTTWENCVLACIPCNRKKADKTPAQAGMKLRREPKKPDQIMHQFDSHKPIKSWTAFIGMAYWSVQLENDIAEE
jgi:hypothetical protein